ncbi:alpha/beta fold hydrolase, partial [Pseudomonas aeruginosa]|uniref:alpha/beta fold hydrolase n=1 Tax=Pseudomonas aeruginosa TaxID=287 RepID=UPI002359BC2E
VVWGPVAAFPPFHFAERLWGKMPNAQINVFDEAGHFLPEDVPEALASRISEFTSSQQGTR